MVRVEGFDAGLGMALLGGIDEAERSRGSLG
jgi:hypothetical protein